MIDDREHKKEKIKQRLNRAERGLKRLKEDLRRKVKDSSNYQKNQIRIDKKFRE